MRLERTPSNSRDLRVSNRLLVLNTIRKQGPIARYEVARETGLTPPPVSVIVNDLIESDIVRETGLGESSGGRRPVMLELNPRAGVVFAVQLQRGMAATALVDLAGEVLKRNYLHLDTFLPESVADAIALSFHSSLEETRTSKAKVLWCGIASPGLVDPFCGVVKRSSNLMWENVPFGPMVSTKLGGIPVHVENTSNAAALAEKAYGSGQGYSNLVYLSLSVGVGAGIIIDNEVYGGSNGFAGEIGHMALVPDGGPRCACGRYGCFEAMCSARAFLSQVRASVADPVLATYGVDIDSMDIDTIRESALLDIPEVRSILKRTGYLTGVVVGNLMNLFDPGIVIIGGELARVRVEFMVAIDQAARERALPETSYGVQIVRSSMKEDPPLMGAYAVALDNVFQTDQWIRNRRKACTK